MFGFPLAGKVGFEEIGEKQNKKTNKDEINRIIASRVISKIKDLAECNNFQFFFTQTLKDNRYDLNCFKKEIQRKFKAYKRKNKDFIYLIIYEKHKNGAFHLHGLVGGIGDDFYINDNGYLSLKFFEDLGFNSLSKIKDKIRVSNYIIKYMTKNLEKTETGYSYFHSKNLNVPFVERVKHLPKNCKLVFENDYLKKWVIKNE